jgi:hypothetical protein
MVLEQRLTVGIHRISVELPHSNKLEPRNPVGPRRIPTELLRPSYEEGSRQAGRPSGYRDGTGVIAYEQNSLKGHSKVSHDVHNP